MQRGEDIEAVFPRFFRAGRKLGRGALDAARRIVTIQVGALVPEVVTDDMVRAAYRTGGFAEWPGQVTGGLRHTPGFEEA